jgi:hypothetical protein
VIQTGDFVPRPQIGIQVKGGHGGKVFGDARALAEEEQATEGKQQEVSVIHQ